MRYKGLTMSDFTPLLHDDVFKGLKQMVYREKQQQIISQRRRFESQVEDSNKR